jgi:hypothetical protein
MALYNNLPLYRGKSTPNDLEVLWWNDHDDKLMFFNRNTFQWEEKYMSRGELLQLIHGLQQQIQTAANNSTKQQAITGQSIAQIAHTLPNQTIIILQVIGASGRSIDPSEYYTQRESDYTQVVFTFPTTGNILYQTA